MRTFTYLFLGAIMPVVTSLCLADQNPENEPAQPQKAEAPAATEEVAAPEIRTIEESTLVSTPETAKTGAIDFQETLFEVDTTPINLNFVAPSTSNVSPQLWTIENAGGIAAVVDDSIITVDELRREVAPLIPQVQRESRSQEEFNARMDALSRHALQHLVDQKVVQKAFERKQEKMKFKIPQTYIDSEYDKYLEAEFNNDRQALTTFLKNQGKTERQFKQEFEEQIQISYMHGQIRHTQAEISPEKIEKYYKDHPQLFQREAAIHLYMITLKEVDREKIPVIEKALEKGEDFPKLAVQYSRDEKRKRGGDWGWINKEDIREEIALKAFAIKPGDTAGPIEVGKSIFFIYIKETCEAGAKPLIEVRREIEDRLAQKNTFEAQQRWLEGLRKKSYIKYYY